MAQTVPSAVLAVDAASSADKSPALLPNGHVSPSVSAAAAIAPSASSLSSLHSDVFGLFSFLDRLSQQDHDERRSVLSRLTSVIHALYPAAEVKPIGSCATELFLPDSDMDLLVRHPARLHPLTISDLHAMGGALQPLCSSLQIISTASVPLIKLTADTITVDITLNVDTGHHSTRLVQSYIDHFPVLRPLVLIVKQLLKARALNDLYSGGLPSYTLILMVVSMLQRDEQGKLDTVVLCDQLQQPSAEERQGDEQSAQHTAGHQKDSEHGPQPDSPLTPIAGATASISIVNQSFPPTLPPDLGMYLLSFLRLYGYTFDYCSLGISVRGTGHYFSKASRQWLHAHNPQLLCVENPLDPAIDLGFKVFHIADIVAYFKEAYQQLTRDQPVSIREAGERAESEAELTTASGVQDVEEMKEFRPTPVLSAVPGTVTDTTLRSPSPQQLPAAAFDHLRTSSAPAHPLQYSAAPSLQSTSTPSSASSASSQQTPSRSSTTSPASPAMKQPTPVPNGFHYPAAALTLHNQQPSFYYPTAMYASPAGQPPPAAASAGNPSPASSAPIAPNVCMGPCCFPPSHVLVSDRHGNVMYIPASFANQLQQANAAQLAQHNGSSYVHYSQATANGISQPQQPQQNQQHQQSQQYQQQQQPSTAFLPPSSPQSAGTHSNFTNPHTPRGGGGGSSGKPYVNGHTNAHAQSPQRPGLSPSGRQRIRGKGGGGSGGGGGGGKSKRVVPNVAVNGHNKQVEPNGNADGTHWQRS